MVAELISCNMQGSFFKQKCSNRKQQKPGSNSILTKEEADH